MRSPRSFKGNLALRHFVVCVAVSAAAACSEASGSGDTRLVVEISQDEVTIENKTGASLMRGEVSIIPQGFARPYVMNLPHLSVGEKRAFQINSFRMSDGSPFRRDVAKGKSVKVTARDLSGQTYEREVPFK